jgi:hypothetical protein
MELFNNVINIFMYIEDFIKDKKETDISKNFNNILKYITNSFTISSSSFITISKAINNIINNLGDKTIILFLKEYKDKNNIKYKTLIKKYNINMDESAVEIKELDKKIAINIKKFLGGKKNWVNTIKKIIVLRLFYKYVLTELVDEYILSKINITNNLNKAIYKCIYLVHMNKSISYDNGYFIRDIDNRKVIYNKWIIKTSSGSEIPASTTVYNDKYLYFNLLNKEEINKLYRENQRAKEENKKEKEYKIIIGNPLLPVYE